MQSNKTYRFQSQSMESGERSPEVQIKVIICKIFSYLMDWRQDYFLDRILAYFQDEFVAPSQVSGGVKEVDAAGRIQLEEKLLQIVPEIHASIGEEIPMEAVPVVRDKSRVEEEIRSFDRIIQKPFIEVLILAFYFCRDELLQNKVTHLIYKCMNQRFELFRRIPKLNLVFSSDVNNQILTQMHVIISQLQGFRSYSQSWLSMIENSNYIEQAEKILDGTLDYLYYLYQMFTTNESASEGPGQASALSELNTKQRIFKHLKGHQIILDFLENGSKILENNYKYFIEEQKEEGA